MAKRAMSSEKASFVKKEGHKKEDIFAELIGLGKTYENDKKAKKDVIDFNGDGHSVKSGTWWQIFLYHKSRIESDYGFLAMNGMGQLILDCLNVFPDDRNKYQANKTAFKTALQKSMRELCEKLQNKNRLKAFLSKAIFNGGEVQFLTIFSGDKILVFYFEDVVEILANSFVIENSKAIRLTDIPCQKVLFRSKFDEKLKNVGEIEVRNDSDIHYREIKFRLNSPKTVQILLENIINYDKPNIINGVENTNIYRYGKAIKKFKTK